MAGAKDLTLTGEALKSSDLYRLCGSTSKTLFVSHTICNYAEIDSLISSRASHFSACAIRAARVVV